MEDPKLIDVSDAEQLELLELIPRSGGIDSDNKSDESDTAIQVIDHSVFDETSDGEIDWVEEAALFRSEPKQENKDDADLDEIELNTADSSDDQNKDSESDLPINAEELKMLADSKCLHMVRFTTNFGTKASYYIPSKNYKNLGAIVKKTISDFNIENHLGGYLQSIGQLNDENRDLISGDLSSDGGMYFILCK